MIFIVPGAKVENSIASRLPGQGGVVVTLTLSADTDVATVRESLRRAQLSDEEFYAEYERENGIVPGAAQTTE